MSDTPYHGIDNLEVLASAERYNRFLVDRIVAASAGRTTAVDFGAGTGMLSVMVRDRGLRVACVELDPSLRERLRGLGFQVYDDLDQVSAQSQEFIYAVNVLEHIEDDQGTLAKFHSRLMSGGRCFLYVPAIQLLYSSMDRKIGHFRRYHRRDLVRIATRAGFVVERAEYADSLGFFVTLLYKAVGSRQGDISPWSVKLYDRVVFPASHFLDRIGCRRLFGKNLLLVMHRPERSGA